MLKSPVCVFQRVKFAGVRPLRGREFVIPAVLGFLPFGQSPEVMLVHPLRGCKNACRHVDS